MPVHYDPILAKIIAWGEDREQALGRLAAALDDTVIQGVVCNLPFLRALARAREVERGAFDTEWIEREFLGGFAALAAAPAPELALAAAAIAALAPEPRAGGDGAESHTRTPGAFETLGPWRLPGLG